MGEIRNYVCYAGRIIPEVVAMARLERIHLLGMTLALLFWTGCDDPGPRAPVEAPPPALVAANEARSGSYEVSGVTVQATSGEQREISGPLKLDVEGERYEVEFDLETTAPDLEGQVPVSVKGSGRGFIVGGVFTSMKLYSRMSTCLRRRAASSSRRARRASSLTGR
jgi:hypothetical protein